MSLLSSVHALALSLPEYERYELASQMRRASKSIPVNIAEGYGKRRSVKEFKSYLANALGSANEMIVHVKVAQALGYVSEDESRELVRAYDVVGKQLSRLIEAWRQFPPPTSHVSRPKREIIKKAAKGNANRGEEESHD